jgi:acyl carrier protein
VRQGTEPRLQEIFRAVLKLGAGADVTQVRQAAEPTWDSLAHVVLVGAVEGEFAIQIDAADSLQVTSYEAMARYLEERGL